MWTLYHHWMIPQARKVRVALAEKGIDFDPRLESPWERRHDFLAINPAGEVPVLAHPEGLTVCGHYAVCEYAEEFKPNPSLLGHKPEERAEVRRLVAWFDEKFEREVTRPIVGEKMHKRLAGVGNPDSRFLRAGYTNIATHLDYIGWLTERRDWLAGSSLTLADIAAASHMSCVDYVGDVPWDDHPAAREWYARIKSRPSFRPLLEDRVPGIAPPDHYPDPDF